MDTIISMVFIFLLIISSILRGLFIGYPLLAALFIFGLLSRKRGYSLQATLKMALEGGKKSFIVLQVFMLIGALTALWISAGTIPSIVYYGIKLMVPEYFVLCTFLITAFVSFLLGTSLGTVSTIGVALIVMAKAGDINLALVTGAIMSGAYFGDRCSPMSSSAILVANLTKTDLFDNIKKMMHTGKYPFILSCILYMIFSLKNPIIFRGSGIHNDLYEIFQIGFIPFIPALIILGASLMKIPVKRSMSMSIVAAFIISLSLQEYSAVDLLSFSFWGFSLEDGLIPGNILNRGGILSMMKAGIVVFISCSMAGILNGTQMLAGFNNIFKKAVTRTRLFLCTIATSALTAMFGCNQTIAVVLTQQLLQETYASSGHSRHRFSIDIENTAIVIAPLIPWNIAAYMPTTTLNVDFYTYIPYAFYLYLLPLGILLESLVASRRSLPITD